MRKARNNWQEICAVLAILVGLVLTGVSWADGGVTWPPNTGPTPNTAKCYQQTGACDNWIEGCIERGTPGYDDNLFDCGKNTVWAYINVDVINVWGYCQGTTGSCTSYNTYYCIHYDVVDNCPGGNTQCSDFWASTDGLCDPKNP